MIVPFYKQELSWSCFAACVRMVLEYYGIEKSEKELRLLSKTTLEGSEWFYVELGLESIGMHFYLAKGFSLGELKELIKNNTPLIVSLKFSEKHPNHTVVVTDITDKFVVVHDPERGAEMQISIEQFLEAWKKRENRAGFITKI